MTKDADILKRIREIVKRWKDDTWTDGLSYDSMSEISDLLAKTEQEPKTWWNNHQIACMLADLFGDACACNYNGIDEWLPELCDFKDTCCPNPVGVACWEQFLKYSQSRYTECGYEIRDKNALQEPKTDTWSIKEIADALERHGFGRLERDSQTSVLDKIRAEIADLDDANYDYEGYYKAVTDALQVIDKYRQEG